MGDLSKHLGTTFPTMDCLPPIAKWLVTLHTRGKGQVSSCTLTCARRNYSCAPIRLQEGSLTSTIMLIIGGKYFWHTRAMIAPARVIKTAATDAVQHLGYAGFEAWAVFCVWHHFWLRCLRCFAYWLQEEPVLRMPSCMQCWTEYYQLANLWMS